VFVDGGSPVNITVFHFSGRAARLAEAAARMAGWNVTGFAP
jgi:hypothetical protein